MKATKLKYPLVRFRFVGDELIEIKYIGPSRINGENFSEREDGGITNNIFLGHETKLEAIQARLRTLESSKDDLLSSLDKLKSKIQILKTSIETNDNRVLEDR